MSRKLCKVKASSHMHPPFHVSIYWTKALKRPIHVHRAAKLPAAPLRVPLPCT